LRERLVLADCTHPASEQKPALRVVEEHQTPINDEGVRHGIHSNSRTLEQRQAGRPKATAKAEGHLGNPNSSSEPHRDRELAMFNLAIDSKLRGCDLVNLRVRDIANGNQILPRAMVVQRKTQRPVQFELTEPTRAAVAAWIEKARLTPDQCLFPSRLSKAPHVSTRQYARIVHQWVGAIGLDPAVYGTHTKLESTFAISASKSMTP
jgi:integrase